MIVLNLLFDQRYAYLGDVSVSEGVFSNAALTKAGEERLGETVASWRAKGISVRKETFGTDEGPKDIIFGTERINAGDKRFLEALRKWADDECLLVLSMNREAASCWHLLIRLPFEGEERFALALSLSKATRPQLEKWRESLEKVIEN
jgi:hypothetical protein